MVSAPDGKIYVIKNGQRHWILDPRWIGEGHYAGQAAVSVADEDIQALEPGSDITYETFGAKLLTVVIAIGLFWLFLVTTLAAGVGSWFWRKVIPGWSGQSLFWESWRNRALVLGAFVVIIVLRAPFLLVHPRFWAEEGTGWFQYASSHPVFQTLFFVHRDSGYLNLLANISSIFSALTASLFSLEYAPMVTTLIALLIHVLAIAIILLGKSRLFDTPWKALVGCCIVLFAPTATTEIWLNTINSMSYLGVITLAVLFLDASSLRGWRRWALRGVLVLCGLSSPYAVALLPLFVWSAWRDKKSGDLHSVHNYWVLCRGGVQFCAVEQVGRRAHVWDARNRGFMGCLGSGCVWRADRTAGYWIRRRAGVPEP